MELVQKVAHRGSTAPESIAIRYDKKSHTYHQLIVSAKNISTLLSNADLNTVSSNIVLCITYSVLQATEHAEVFKILEEENAKKYVLYAIFFETITFLVFDEEMVKISTHNGSAHSGYNLSNVFGKIIISVMITAFFLLPVESL